MGTYIHFSEEQKQRANSIDLAEFLRRQGETLLPSGREKRLKSNHSITVRGNEWFDHATKEGGLAIDFVQTVYGLSFPEAVTMLLGGEQGIAYVGTNEKVEKKRPFELPSKNNDMCRVFAYLIKHRLIDQEVVSFFAKEKLIYESKEQSADRMKEYHNAIFVGYDENGVPRHAHKRGIYTEGKSFKGNIDSSNPGYSFHYIGTSDRLYVFEAPIDLMSFITLHKNADWKKHSYVALCGLSEQAIIKTLENHTHLNRVALCLDHDPAGIEASEKIVDQLGDREIDCTIMQPKYKDWNEDLKSVYNGLPIAAEDHPQHVLKKQIYSELLNIASEYSEKSITFEKCKEALQKSLTEVEHQAEAMKVASALFLCLCKSEGYKRGITMTLNELIEEISDRFKAYQNRGRLDPKYEEIKSMFDGMEALKGSGKETSELLEVYKKISLELMKTVIKKEMAQQKQEQNISMKMA